MNHTYNWSVDQQVFSDSANHMKLDVTLFLKLSVFLATVFVKSPLNVLLCSCCSQEYNGLVIIYLSIYQARWHLSKVLFCDCLTLSASLAPETFRPNWALSWGGRVCLRQHGHFTPFLFLLFFICCQSKWQYFQRTELDIGEAQTVCSETISSWFSWFFCWPFLHVYGYGIVSSTESPELELIQTVLL